MRQKRKTKFITIFYHIYIPDISMQLNLILKQSQLLPSAYSKNSFPDFFALIRTDYRRSNAINLCEFTTLYIRSPVFYLPSLVIFSLPFSFQILTQRPHRSFMSFGARPSSSSSSSKRGAHRVEGRATAFISITLKRNSSH